MRIVTAVAVNAMSDLVAEFLFLFFPFQAKFSIRVGFSVRIEFR